MLDKKKKHSLAGFKRQFPLTLMVLPALIFVAVFSYSPLTGWGMAFFRYRPGRGIFEGDFLGLEMFQDFFYDMSGSWYVLKNTLGINLFIIIINLSLAILVSILINEMRMKRMKKVVQTITFFPYFISWVITYTVFQMFFSTSNGMVNQVLEFLGVIDKGVDFLGDPDWAWFIMIVASAWKSTGYNSVIFLSSISSIDAELYEAAQIDGASRLRRIWSITLPHLVPTLSVLLIMNAGWILNSNFEQFFLFSNMSNQTGMEVFDTYIYRYGMGMLNFSYATAVGMMKSVASIALLIFANSFSKAVSKRGIM